MEDATYGGTQALIVPVNRDEPTIPFEVTDYTQYQTIVDGTFDIARSWVLSPNGGRVEISVYINDEGLIFNMAHNPRASKWAGQDLVGTAVITGGVDMKGNTLSIPSFLQRLVDNDNQQWLEQRAAQSQGA